MVMVGQATIILTMVWGMVAAATDNGVWVAVENRIDSFSSTVNNSLNVPTGKHIIGLSNPAFQHDQFSYIFATELGVRGPAVYQISKHEQTLLAELTGFFANVDETVTSLIIHDGTNSYTCARCSKTCSQRNHLMRHIISKHVSTPAVDCQFCGKQYKNQNSLQVHISQNHREQWQQIKNLI